MTDLATLDAYGALTEPDYADDPAPAARARSSGSGRI